MDTCLHMLKNASPTEEDDEEETIRDLEGLCLCSTSKKLAY